MDKIRTLLEQIGGKPELVTKIMESLEAHKVSVDEQVQGKYRERLEKAKQACLEEVESYKRDISRKVQLFLESRVEKIEQQIAKQVAIKDSAAESKLRDIVALLEGIEVNSDGDNADLRAVQKQAKELQEHVKKSKGRNKILTEKANRASAIAEKTLMRNKVLAEELAKTQKKKPIAEGKTKPKAKGKAKTKPKAKTIAEDKKRSAKPKTNRMSTEDHIAKPKKRRPPKTQSMGGFSPAGIADQMD